MTIESSVSKWVEHIQAHYDVHVKYVRGTNHFIAETWQISDPQGNGLSFVITADSKGLATMLDLREEFDFPRFNGAEGFSPEFLLKCAESFLTGDLPVEYSSFLKLPFLHYSEADHLHAYSTMNVFRALSHKKEMIQRLEKARQGYLRK